MATRPRRWFQLPLLPHAALLVLAAAAPIGCSSNDSPSDDDAETASSAEPSATNTPRVRERNADSDSSASDSNSSATDSDSSATDSDEASETPANGSPAAASSSDGAPSSPASAGTIPEATDEPAAPAAPAFTFAACTTAGGPYSDCDTIYVTAVQQSPARCIQLTIDNCGTYGRQGLSADTPSFWRLASGSIGAASDPCELGVFYPGNPSLADATGNVTWNEDTPRPTDLAFDLSLELSSSPDAPIPLATNEPLQLAECDE